MSPAGNVTVISCARTCWCVCDRIPAIGNKNAGAGSIYMAKKPRAVTWTLIVVVVDDVQLSEGVCGGAKHVMGVEGQRIMKTSSAMETPQYLHKHPKGSPSHQRRSVHTTREETKKARPWSIFHHKLFISRAQRSSAAGCSRRVTGKARTTNGSTSVLG